MTGRVPGGGPAVSVASLPPLPRDMLEERTDPDGSNGRLELSIPAEDFDLRPDAPSVAAIRGLADHLLDGAPAAR